MKTQIAIAFTDKKKGYHIIYQKHNTTFNTLHKNNAPSVDRKRNERAHFPTVSCTSQKHQK